MGIAINQDVKQPWLCSTTYRNRIIENKQKLKRKRKWGETRRQELEGKVLISK